MTAPDRTPQPARATVRPASTVARRRFAPRPLALALASASLLSLPLADISPAQAQQAALPSGLAVMHGQASAVVDGNRMTVTNSANSILNWNSFSIGAANGVHFAQPDAASKVLNRVVGNDPSAILGSLSSNGGVWLLNPHGVLFGQGARVDVGHLVTSTLRLNDVDWLNGRFNFAAAGADRPAGIVNRGELRSSLGGHIALLGGSVANENLVEAPGGQVLLAAGRSIDLLDTGSPHLRLRVTAPADAALNLGTLAAAGGRIDVHGAVVNQQGVVRADSFGVNAAGEIVLQASKSLEIGAGSTTSASGTGAGGRITVDAGREGTATIRGDLLASGGDAAGGRLTLLGQRIGLTDAARLDVSGASGGSMHIGGGERGQDPALPNSQALFVGSGVTLKADAGKGSGDGGRIILWSDEATRAYGHFSARGGVAGGSGGFIETSGGWIDIQPAGVDASAPAGKAGSWLLDPGDITITSDTSDRGITQSGSNPVRYESNADGATLQAQTIERALSGGSSVIVATGNPPSSESPGDIFVRSATINPSAAGAVSLTLQAHRNIEISNSIIATRGGPLSVDLRADGTGTGGVVAITSSTVRTGGGSIAASGAGFDDSRGNRSGSGIALSGANLSAGSGTVVLNGSSRAVNGFGNSGIVLSGSPIQAGTIELNGSHSSTSGSGYQGVRIVGSSLTATGSMTISGSASGIGVDASSDTTLQVTPAPGAPSGGMVISGTNTRVPTSQPATDNHGVRISGDYGGLLQTTNGAPISITGSHRGGPAAALLLTDGVKVEAGGEVSLVANSPLVVSAQITAPAPISLRADDVTLAAGAQLTSTAPGDAIVIAGRPNPNTSRFVNNAGDGALSTPSGRWLIYGQNSASVQPGGLPFDFQQYNARFGETAPAATGNGLLYAEAQNVTISGNKLQKVYDGSTVIGPLSSAGPTFSGQRNGDAPTLSPGANGTLADANVGSDKPVAVAPSAVSFRDAAGRPVFGYTLVSNLLGDVTRRPVSLTGVTAQNKVYDGNRTAQVGFAGLSGLVSGETLNATAAGLFDTKDAGTAKNVLVTATLADGTGGGRASNYQLSPASTTARADILRRQLTITDPTAQNKVYDGNRNATVGFAGIGNLVGSETLVTTATGLFDTKDVGTAKPVDVLVAIADGSNGGLASNYLAPTVSPALRADVTPRPVQANALSVADKAYDGTRSAAVTLGPLTGLVSGETLTGSASGLFDTKDAGTAKPVLVDVLLGNGGGGGLASNYRFIPPTNPTASIRPAPLTVRANDASKTFGQTLTFNGTEFAASGLQAGETVGLVTLQSAGAASAAPVAGSPYPIVASNARGGSFDPRNYDIQYRDGVLTVERADLRAVLVGIIGNPTKTYDGTDAATLAPANFGLSGFVGSDSASVTQTSGRYDSANAGSRTVSATLARADYAPVGATDLNNYQLPTSASGPGTITPRTVTLNGVQADSKVYDGSTVATLARTGTLSGLVGSETLGVNVGDARFASKDAGIGKLVTIGSASLQDGTNGGRASNYVLAPVDSTRADITPRPVQANSLTVADKTYDATRSATVSVGPLSGLVAGETLTTSATGLFDTKDVGTAKPVSVDVALGNGPSGDTRNYRFDAPANPTASIRPAPLTVRANDAAKTFGQTLTFNGTEFVASGLQAGETVGLVTLQSAGAASTAPVAGSPYAIVASNARGGSFDPRNYDIQYRDGVLTVARAGLQAVLVGIIGNPTKTYDGTDVATLAPANFGLSGFVGSDSASVTQTSGRYDSANAGSRTVSATLARADYAPVGATDLNNYQLPATATGAGTIVPRTLTLNGTRADSKVYDASVSATLASLGTLGGLVGTQTLQVSAGSARFDTKDVGTGKAVTVSGIGLADGTGLASNYRIAPTAVTSADITPAMLTYFADPQRKVVGEALPALTGDVSGFVAGETQAGATTGTLRFETPATAASPAGLYAINGTGLTAGNYRFVQAPGNATALNVGAVEISTADESSRSALTRSVQAVTPPPAWSGPTEGRVFDVIQALRGSFLNQGALFRPIPVADLSQDSLSSLLAARDRYKKALFSAAIRRLEQDPTLADLPACASVQEVDNGSCLITEDLKGQLRRQRATTQIALPAQPPAPATTPAAAAAPPAPPVAVAPAAPAADADAAIAMIPPAAPREGVGTLPPEAAPQPFFSRRVRTAALPQIARKIAIVVGIDNYADRRIPQLDNAIKDARTVGQVLESTLGYETVVLENATRQSLVRTLNRLAVELDPNDSVVVYYAGHGELVQATGLGYWQLSDANPNRPETWMSNADISRLIGRIGAQQVALISDSCYSGSLVDERIRARPGNVNPQELLAKKSVVVMSSGGNEPVFDEGKNGHSPFAFSLMRNLEQVANWQVGGNVFERVRFAVARELPQRPVYGSAASAGHQAGGDYLFEQRQLAP